MSSTHATKTVGAYKRTGSIKIYLIISTTSDVRKAYKKTSEYFIYKSRSFDVGRSKTRNRKGIHIQSRLWGEWSPLCLFNIKS